MVMRFFNSHYSISPVLAIFLLLPLSACQTPVQEGDAVSYGQGDFRSSFLPRFPLGKTGSYVFRVANLQSRSFPARIRIYGRTGAYSYGPRADTFSGARLRVEVLDDSSRRVLAAKTFRLNTARFVKEGEHDQFFWSRSEPNLEYRKNYRVRVTVLTPSDREWDEARVMLR